MKTKHFLPALILSFFFLCSTSYGQTAKTVTKGGDVYVYTFPEVILASYGADEAKIKDMLGKLWTNAFTGKLNAFADSMTRFKVNLRPKKNVGEIFSSIEFQPDPMNNPDYVITRDSVIVLDPSKIAWCDLSQVLTVKGTDSSTDVLAIGPGYFDTKKEERLLWFIKADVEKILGPDDTKWLVAILTKKQ